MENLENDAQEDRQNSKPNPVKKEKKGGDTVAGIIGLAIIALFFYWIWSWAFGDDFNYKKKDELQAEIATMAKNGADLDSIKHHLSTAFTQSWGLIYRWSNEKSEHYRSDVLLLTVLKDIQNKALLDSEKKIDTSEILKLISVHQQKNPFDGLEPNQKDLFENIRVKLNDNYGLISSDLNKLSDEFAMKNGLVNQYLSDSKTSLYISIASLAFGVVFPILGMLFKRRKSSNKPSQTDS